MGIAFFALTSIISIVALVTIIVGDDGQIRHLPKFAWVLLVVFLPLIGSILWFALGRDWSRGASRDEPVSFGDPRRTERARERAPQSSTEAQLAALDREIEFYEKQAQIAKLEAELERKQRGEG